MQQSVLDSYIYYTPGYKGLTYKGLYGISQVWGKEIVHRNMPRFGEKFLIVRNDLLKNLDVWFVRYVWWAPRRAQITLAYFSFGVLGLVLSLG